MKTTEKIEIDVNVIFSIKDQKFYLDVRKYIITKQKSFIKSISICFTEILNIDEVQRIIHLHDLIKRETSGMYIYINKFDLKNHQ